MLEDGEAKVKIFEVEAQSNKHLAELSLLSKACYASFQAVVLDVLMCCTVYIGVILTLVMRACI